MRLFHTNQKGLTLIETLVASAIFVVFSIAIYRLYSTVFTLSSRIRTKTVMTEIAGEQFEFIRNLAYGTVGTVGGIPSGIVTPVQTITRNGSAFTVTTTIRNIDDPADGTLGGTPNDLSPADKKLVEIEVTCAVCKEAASIVYTSVVAPKNLETENGNGALVIRAIDANGQPVPDAQVQIVNTALTPSVTINDVTGATGVLTIVDAPPSSQRYQITVTKDGFSTERTYTPGATGNPSPTKPHLTVAANTITQSTFSIDRKSTYTIVTQSLQCSVIGNVSGTLTGTKLIGTAPDVIKHLLNFTTGSFGEVTLGDIEWDTYSLAIGGTTYDVVGTNPISPLVVPPGSTQALTITLASNNPQRLVIGVVDSAGLPLAEAGVTISGPSGTFSDTTNIGSVTQTDWSGGAGQLSMGDADKFDTSSNIHFSSAGALSLLSSGTYLTPGALTSSVIDLGGEAVFHQLSWLPATQPAGVGTNPVQFQIATSATNDEETIWNYLGPDGTDATYYTANPSNINTLHDGMRYVRYRVFLSTANPAVTPTLTDVALTYTAGCLPPGQVDFAGLSNGTYHVTVSKSGFQTFQKDITINKDTYDTITLTP